MFPGQGSQAVGMGFDVFEGYGIFREIFDMASEIAAINLQRLCFKGPLEELTMTVNLQPAITAVNLGLLALIEKENVQPSFSAGHSLGEYAALCATRAISKEDAVRLVVKRGELMHREAGRHRGAMSAVVGLSIDAVGELVEQVRSHGVVSVANHNAELQIVITGSPGPVEAVSALARERGAKTIPLKVSGAWHSDLIRGAEAEFREFLDSIPFRSPESALLFNVTAETESDPGEIRSLMAKQLCSPVKWHHILKKMIEAEVEVFAEIGPGKVLAGLLKKTLPPDYPAEVHTVNSLKSLESFLKAVK